MDKLKNAEALVVRQKKEWGEILTGFETKNKYAVMDASGQELYFAAEESSFLARFFLKIFRPFSVHVVNRDGRHVIKGVKPFRFYFHEMEVLDGEGRIIGKICRRFSLLTKKFEIRDHQDLVVCELEAPFFHPWTFKIGSNGSEVGEIVKKWSGLGKEMFTDADNFSVKFPLGADVSRKALLLGALFLIDMVYFEK